MFPPLSLSPLRQWSRSEESGSLGLRFPKKELEKQVSFRPKLCLTFPPTRLSDVSAFPLSVSSPGFADVQILRRLCHLHLPLHLRGSDVCHERVSMATEFRCCTSRREGLWSETRILASLSNSPQTLGMSFGVLVCVLLLTLAICFAGHLPVSVTSSVLCSFQRQSLAADPYMGVIVCPAARYLMRFWP